MTEEQRRALGLPPSNSGVLLGVANNGAVLTSPQARNSGPIGIARPQPGQRIGLAPRQATPSVAVVRQTRQQEIQNLLKPQQQNLQAQMAAQNAKNQAINTLLGVPKPLDLFNVQKGTTFDIDKRSPFQRGLDNIRDVKKQGFDADEFLDIALEDEKERRSLELAQQQQQELSAPGTEYGDTAVTIGETDEQRAVKEKAFNEKVHRQEVTKKELDAQITKADQEIRDSLKNPNDTRSSQEIVNQAYGRVDPQAIIRSGTQVTERRLQQERAIREKQNPQKEVSTGEDKKNNIPNLASFAADVLRGIEDKTDKIPIVGDIAEIVSRLGEAGLRPTAAIQELIQGDLRGARTQLDKNRLLESSQERKAKGQNIAQQFLPAVGLGAQGATLALPAGRIAGLAKTSAKLAGGIGATAGLTYEGGRQLQEDQFNPLALAVSGVAGGTVGAISPAIARKISRSPNGTKPGEVLTADDIEPDPLKMAAPEGKKLNVFDKVFGRARNNLEKLGAGDLSARAQVQRADMETTLAQWSQMVPTVPKLSKSEADNFAMASQKLAEPQTPRVAQAVKEWGNLRQEVLLWARERGITVAELDEYFPRMFDAKALQGSRYNKIVEQVTQSVKKEGLGDEEAARVAADSLQRLHTGTDVIRDRKVSSLDYSRTANVDTGYRTDKNVVFDYLKDVAKRGSEVKAFGEGDSEALKIIQRVGNKLGREGEDQAQKLFDTIVEARPNSAATKASSIVRSFNAITKLGLGAITNTQQSLNTLSQLGIRPTAAALVKLRKPDTQKFISDTGVTLESVLKDIRTGSGYSTEVLGKYAAPGFNTVERFNRGLAAAAARNHGKDLARKAAEGNKQAIRQLDELGVSGESISRRGTLTPKEEISIGRKAVQDTQFRLDPQDLPAWASTPLGKVVAQFRTFSYNQTAFAARLFQEAAKGNVRPLATWAALVVPTGYAAAKTTDYFRYGILGQEAPEKSKFDYFTRAGGVGLPTDFIQNYRFAEKTKDEGRKVASVAGALGGPTAGTAVQAIDALVGSGEDKSKFAINQIPVVGPTLTHALFPYQPKNKVAGVENRLKGLMGNKGPGAEDIQFSDEEREKLSTFVDGKSGKMITDAKRLREARDKSSDPVERAALAKLIQLGASGDKVALKDAQLDNRYNNGEIGTAEYNIEKAKNADKAIDQSIYTPDSLSQKDIAYLRGANDKDVAAYLRGLRAQGRGQEADAISQDLINYSNEAAQRGSQRYSTELERIGFQDKVRGQALQSLVSEEAAGIAGASKQDLERALQAQPGLAGQIPGAIQLTQNKALQDLITASSAKSKTRSLEKLFGGGTSSGGSSGGKGRSGGKKRSGGRSGRSRGSRGRKITVKKGRAGKKPSLKKTKSTNTLASLFPTSSSRRPLTFEQILRQLNGG